ncbi:uncharacterized protein LOC101848206 [Aplysia californica]|uniref:Uncharacterized protein LOC101848206 n=1 Tax=Aplysia californica TaxID=6500 RepID=A0ABM1A0S2_APLCA|nr:uncharacterized protein LOC101848206 [Aplysia californica]
MSECESTCRAVTQPSSGHAHTAQGEEPRPQSVPEKLHDKEAEEQFRRENPILDRQHPRYRGITTSLGNPVFSNTPCEPPEYVQPQVTYGVPGYKRPKQHPYYQTSSAEYGDQPYPEVFPLSHHGRTFGFTKRQSQGGMYEDAHFTTQIDGQPTSP